MFGTERAQKINRRSSAVAAFLVSAIICAAAMAGQAQNKQVANYSTGTYNSDSYEHFSFWVQDGKRASITYSTKNRDKELQLVYLGGVKSKEGAGFKVRFPNKLVLTIVPQGDKLKVFDSRGKYVKYFSWEYEGPVDGRGTACNVCVGEGAAAIKFVNQYFLQ